MNELHGIGICDITSPFNDEFHEKQIQGLFGYH